MHGDAIGQDYLHGIILYNTHHVTPSWSRWNIVNCVCFKLHLNNHLSMFFSFYFMCGTTANDGDKTVKIKIHYSHVAKLPQTTSTLKHMLTTKGCGHNTTTPQLKFGIPIFLIIGAIWTCVSLRMCISVSK